MTTKGGLQRRQHGQPLFAQRGQVATNASKGVSESLAAKAAGDFLLHLDHAKISFGEIISKSTRRSSRKVRTAAAVCASDRANCERHFVCIDPVSQGELWPEGAPDPRHRAAGETALPKRRLPAGQASAFLAHAPALSPPSYPARSF
jgi:hypothetical protein